MGLYEPKIVYAREIEDSNRFVIVMRMQQTFGKKMTYIGGIAVIADIEAHSMQGNPFFVLSTKISLNWIDYKEVNPIEFIAFDQKQMLQIEQIK